MTEKQETALRAVCERFKKPFRKDDYSPGIGCGDGWLEGWVGGTPLNSIYVGCSPEGRIHS